MKNLILGLILILSLQSFSQGKFRGMSWGTTSSQLKSNYPDAQWESETEGKDKVFTTEDYVGGLEVKVAYYFIDDKLKMGVYIFNENHTSDNMYYDDFISISTTLNKKYDMEMNKNWNDTTWENNPNYIGHALRSGDVEIIERNEHELTGIVHYISSDNNGGIEHILVYRDTVYMKKMRALEVDDF